MINKLNTENTKNNIYVSHLVLCIRRKATVARIKLLGSIKRKGKERKKIRGTQDLMIHRSQSTKYKTKKTKGDRKGR